MLSTCFSRLIAKAMNRPKWYNFFILKRLIQVQGKSVRLFSQNGASMKIMRKMQSKSTAIFGIRSPTCTVKVRVPVDIVLRVFARKATHINHLSCKLYLSIFLLFQHLHCWNKTYVLSLDNRWKLLTHSFNLKFKNNLYSRYYWAIP